MANDNVSILGAELVVADGKATATLDDFYSKLETMDRKIGALGNDRQFARGFTDQLTDVERRVGRTKSIFQDAFSPENLVKGAAFATVVKFLNDSVEKSLEAADANRKLAASATEAGKAYNELSESNKKFAHDAGLADTAAASITARIQQLANATGKPQDLEKLQKGFLDLAGAKGIKNDELDSLIGTILSGQDEGLNRLGLSDPSKLQAAYAASIHKTVDALTNQEKTQAAVNAVMEKAAVFAGANEEKMKSLTGQIETSRATFNNLETQIGRNITESLLFRDAVNLLGESLKGVSLNVDDVQAKLAKGLKPKEIAEEMANSFGGQLTIAFQNTTGAAYAAPLYIYDVFTKGFDEAMRNYIETSTGASKRYIDSQTKLIENEQKLIEKQAKDALDQTKLNAQKAFEAEQKAADELAQKRVEKQLERAIQTNRSINEIYKIVEKLPGVGQEQNQDRDNRVVDYIVSQIEKGRSKVVELQKNALEAFDSIARRVTADNPFASFFSDVNDQVAKLRENTKGLKVESREWLETLLARQNEVTLFGLRLDNALNSDALRESARNFRNPKLTEQEINSRIDNYLRRDEHNAGNAYLAGLDQGKGAKITPEVTANLLTYQSIDTILRYGKGTNSKFFTGFLARQFDQIKNGDDGSISDRLQRQLEIVERVRNQSLGGTNDAELSKQIDAATDRKIIALTGNLDPTKITAYQREQAASAAERQAARLDRSEKEGREIEQSKLKAINSIKDELVALRKIADQEGLAGVVRIVDESNGAAQTTVEKAKPIDTEKLYKQNLPTRSRNGLSNY